MFGGWGISSSGCNIAIVANPGAGDALWLKADDANRSHYVAAHCRQFSYVAKGVERSVNYYSVPVEAMESAQDMAPWAQLALECALRARRAKEERSRSSNRQPIAPKASTSRAAAPSPRTAASRKSRTG